MIVDGVMKLWLNMKNRESYILIFNDAPYWGFELCTYIEREKWVLHPSYESEDKKEIVRLATKLGKSLGLEVREEI